MAEKEIIIALAELGKLELVCPNCNTSVTTGSEDSRFPTKCSACGEILAVGIANIGEAWKAFVRQAKEATI